ncbi:MAG TPA: DUF4173 domain-containing protein [Ginsengibacter sp.]
MKKTSSKLFVIFAGAFIFNIIFWKEKLGLNTILFDGFICVSVCLLFPYSLKNNTGKWLFAGHIITAAMVVIQNTLLSKISFTVTLLLFVSFSQYLHRSVWYAAGSSIQNYFLAIPNFFHELKAGNSRSHSSFRRSKSFRILLIPILILIVFTIIYSFANSVFYNIIGDMANAISNWLSHFFDWFSVPRLGFFLLGIVIVSGLILSNKNTYFSDIDMKMKNDFYRKKSYFKKWKESAWADLLTVITGKSSSGMLALKSELTMGSVSLLLLNALLLLINIIDVKYVWLGFTFHKDANMAAYVHEGAWLLIFSIVLAMLLLLFFFRGNLNFYKKNKWLRYGAYCWILQNSFLVLSVFNRDYYYIVHFGLAYKRIGLLFFLAMVLAGLITVFIKIYYTKTIYFLLRINAWVGIILLVLASLINWDETIATYNLARKSTIPLDVPFLLSLSDKTLPLLQKNGDVLEKYSSVDEQFYYDGSFHNAIDFFKYRKENFLLQQNRYTWLSWNLTDDFVKKELAGNTHLSLLK